MLRPRLLVLPLILLLTSCLSFGEFKEKAYKGYGVDDLPDITQSPYQSLAQQLVTQKLIDQACFGVYFRPNNSNTSTDVPSTNNNLELETDNPASEVVCQQQRNTIVSAIIYNSEQLCFKHRKSIYGNEATFNLVLGSFTNVFAGAAAVVNPASTKSILSALALASNSERSLINDTIYKTVLIEAVDTKIMQRRTELAQNMRDKFRENINDYPVSVALNDVADFHYSCSFMDGLRLALQEGTDERPKQKLTRLKSELQSVNLELSTKAQEIDEISSASSAKMTILTTQKNALIKRAEQLNTEILKVQTQ